MMQRSSGILLPVFSLPSPYGIGTLGKAAYDFVDFLVAARQSFWQILPLGPTGEGNSPYQSCSAAAGNPYLIDLDTLITEGLLRPDETACDRVDDARRVDYERVGRQQSGVLRLAFARAERGETLLQEIRDFAQKNAAWLDDYALFMALKDENGARAWTQWPLPERMRTPEALALARARLAQECAFHEFVQFLFFRQWHALKAYANAKGVRIIGDVPIYVPLDSADVWAEPQEFLLDEARKPLAVAGVPPDYFTADGQLWGNPLYDWAHMQQTGFAWWMRRMQAASELFDAVRIDHFRGLSSYWEVPVGEATARNGRWAEGPGIAFVDALKSRFPQMEIIAEDLGYLTDDVRTLVDASGFPGMKVLQFAFDAREPSNYLPHTYPRHCVCYTGTHDNTTAAGWFDEASAEDAAFAVRYLGLNRDEGYHWGLIRGGMGSVADLFVAQMQDYLGLDACARMNTPGTVGENNWRWRLLEGELTSALAERIAELCRMYGR